MSQIQVSQIRVVIASIVGVVGLSGCFTSTADFQKDAERYIQDVVAPDLDVAFNAVTCEQPLNQNVGTRFSCSAIDANGDVWEFDNLIDATNEFTVNVSRRP